MKSGLYRQVVFSAGTGFNEKPFSRGTKSVVFVDRWSFYTGGH